LTNWVDNWLYRVNGVLNLHLHILAFKKQNNLTVSVMQSVLSK